jgi:hypothetical protein
MMFPYVFKSLLVASIFGPNLAFAAPSEPPLLFSRWLVGSIVGSGVGFGSGHYVQGRIGKGVFFSVSEPLFLISFLASGISFLDSGLGGARAQKSMLVSLSGFVLLRGYEIYDVWTFPHERPGVRQDRNTPRPTLFQVPRAEPVSGVIQFSPAVFPDGDKRLSWVPGIRADVGF